jgi:hypothetical protein
MQKSEVTHISNALNKQREKIRSDIIQTAVTCFHTKSQASGITAMHVPRNVPY